MSDERLTTLGVDVGALQTKLALLGGERGEELLASRLLRTTGTTTAELDALASELLASAGVDRDALTSAAVTGGAFASAEREPLLLGRRALVADELTCVAAAVSYFHPEVELVLHVGGQSMAALRLDAEGEVVDYVKNDKCAAGSGRFVEMIGARLGVALGDVDARCAAATAPAAISEQCVVFAESEVIGQINAGVEVADALAGVVEALASIISVVAQRAGNPRGDGGSGRGAVCVTGGVGRFASVVAAVGRRLEVEPLSLLDLDPLLAPAIGAALLEPADG